MRNSVGIVGGLTRQQVEFFHSAPAAEWVGEAKDPGKSPYIPAAIVEAALCAGCGPGGWSLDVVESGHQMLSPFTSHDGKKTIYTVIGTAKVRITVNARDESGHLIMGAEAFHVEGIDSHALVCHSQSGVASIIGNAMKAAVSRAMRSAASRIGPVFGRDLMRNRKDNAGRTLPVSHFVSDAWPTMPEFPCMGDGAGQRPGFDAAALLRSAMSAGDDEIDADGEAYDPHTGEVRQPEPAAAQRERRAPAQPAQAQQATAARQQSDKPAPAPVQAATPSAPPAQQSTSAGFARPAWMTPADHERIGRNDVFRGDDDKQWVVAWIGPDGAVVRRFTADPEATMKALPGRLNMPTGHSIKIRLRDPDDAQVGEPAAWGAAKPASVAPAAAPNTPPRHEALAQIRDLANRLRETDTAGFSRLGEMMKGLGFGSISELRNANDATVANVYQTIFRAGE